MRRFAMIRHAFGPFGGGRWAPAIEAEEMTKSLNVGRARFRCGPTKRVHIAVEETKFSERTAGEIHGQAHGAVLKQECLATRPGLLCLGTVAGLRPPHCEQADDCGGSVA